MKNKNLYEIFGIRQNATISEIKQAYKRNIHKYHPDISKDPDSADKFKEIIRAYKIINNPQKRFEYDQKLKLCKVNGSQGKEKRTINIRSKLKDQKSKFGFFVKNTINKKYLTNYFIKLKLRRFEKKKEKFIKREILKIEIKNDENFVMYNNLDDMQIMARLKNKNNHYVRLNAVKIIAFKKEKKYFFDLIKLLSDNSGIVRKEVVKTLGIIKDYRAINFLVNIIYDYEEMVRCEVAKVFRNFEDTRAVAALLNLLKDSNEKVICEAILSLGVLGDADVEKEIRKLLRHPSVKVKRASLEVLKILR
ncbi:MAG: hypothetical protein B6I28_01340 [Fusobacteriia bacterium 4572_132]|nr:MAG: hypothetical protein B6I28_01340 [Fusobacteriia bacterium 4572_132]